MIIPDFEGFSIVVTNRLLPTFDTFGDEALKHGEKWFRDNAAGLDPLHDDQYEAGAYLAGKAMDNVLAFADVLAAMYFASIGVYRVGLFHLFEQHFTDLPLQILGNHTYAQQIKCREVVDWLKADVSIDVTAFMSWPVIDELRLVANTVKHAEGASATALRGCRPDLFIHPAEREGGGWPAATFLSRIRKPLFGEDLYLTPDDFTRYVGGIITFWSKLAASLAKH